MKARGHTHTIIKSVLIIAALITLAGPVVQAALPTGTPVTASSFEKAAPRGFGDRNNSWAQSMAWWHSHLYVGTGRQSLCTSLFAVWHFVSLRIDNEFADTWFPYPPSDPDLSCPPDGTDLSLQAEIWRWGPAGGGTWEMVFQSPLDLDNPGPFRDPPPVTKKVPYEITIRGMTTHIEPTGREALYAFGVNSTILWDREKLPPPRILRSVNGVTFTPIPQTPGTFLGTLPFNPDHSSFRSPVSYRGKLFVLSGPAFGQGALIGSADPAKGDDAWFLASPPEMQFYALEVFNGWLYLGGFDPINGYSVLKTRAEGPPPYDFITVVPAGAYLPKRPSKSVVSMHEYFGRLYVGTASQTEVIRINPDDTWDLVVGPPRVVPTSEGGSEWKYPLSGLDAGFGQTLNDHAWQMEDFQNQLYIGTYNASIAAKDHPEFGPLLEHNMGAHLYRTRDGWYYSAVTTNGFADPSDPYGGRFDYGIRTMASTPYGLFLGTVNDHYGLAIFRGKPPAFLSPEPPQRLEIEETTDGSALLSWKAKASTSYSSHKYKKKKPKPTVQRYQVWRAEVHPILVRDDVNFEGWNGSNGNKVPDTYIGPYELIAVTEETNYIDSTVQPDKKYMYYVLAEADNGNVSEQSNLVAFPPLAPPTTFVSLLTELDRVDERQRYKSPMTMMILRTFIEAAQTLAAECKLDAAITKLNPLNAYGAVKEPEATDVEILMSKLIRRIELFKQFPQEMNSDEFCTIGS